MKKELLENELRTANINFGLFDEDGNKTTHYQLNTQMYCGTKHLILVDDRNGSERNLQVGTTKEIYTSLKTANNIVYYSKKALEEKANGQKKELTAEQIEQLNTLNTFKRMYEKNESDKKQGIITATEYEENRKAIERLVDAYESKYKK